MIEALTGFPENVAAFACKGHVTRDDYETVLVPAIESALAMNDKLRIYYEIGDDFYSIDPGAVFEDIKVGMGHLSHLERIAVVTDVDWIRLTMRAFAFLIPARMQFFATAGRDEARAWISE